MKVLQVNCVYRDGSTGKIVYDIHSQLQKQGIESVVCYGRGAKTEDLNVYKTCGELYSKANHLLSYFTGLMYGGCYFSTNRLISIIKKEKPDVVHLHCINGYFVNVYRIITWLKEHKIKTVLTLHAEFMHSGKTGCGSCPRLRQETKSLLFDRTHTSWVRMKKAFDGFSENLIVASVSPWLMERAKESQILSDKTHKVVLNGLNTELFRRYDTMKLRKSHGITDEKIVFHATVTFNDDPGYIKGGHYVIETAKRFIGKKIKFIIAGPYDPALVVPENVVLLGKITDQTLLAQYYAMADVTLLTSRKETFSMICAESLCCGTPVVGFRAGGPESIAIPEYSYFCDYGDIQALCDMIRRILTSNYDRAEIAKEAAIKYSKERMVSEYLNAYMSIQ